MKRSEIEAMLSRRAQEKDCVAQAIDTALRTVRSHATRALWLRGRSGLSEAKSIAARLLDDVDAALNTGCTLSDRQLRSALALFACEMSTLLLLTHQVWCFDALLRLQPHESYWHSRLSTPFRAFIERGPVQCARSTWSAFFAHNSFSVSQRMAAVVIEYRSTASQMINGISSCRRRLLAEAGEASRRLDVLRLSRTFDVPRRHEFSAPPSTAPAKPAVSGDPERTPMLLGREQLGFSPEFAPAAPRDNVRSFELSPSPSNNYSETSSFVKHTHWLYEELLKGILHDEGYPVRQAMEHLDDEETGTGLAELETIEAQLLERRQQVAQARSELGEESSEQEQAVVEEMKSELERVQQQVREEYAEVYTLRERINAMQQRVSEIADLSLLNVAPPPSADSVHGSNSSHGERDSWATWDAYRTLALVRDTLRMLDLREQAQVQRARNFHKPSHFNRHWVHYSLGAAACLGVSRLMWRHGSVLWRFAVGTYDAVRQVLNENLWQPLCDIYRRLFAPQALDVQSLPQILEMRAHNERLLRDFLVKHGDGQLTKSQIDDAVSRLDMSFVNQKVEKGLASPMQFAALPSALMLQVQNTRLQLDQVLFETSQLIDANEITAGLTAMLPAGLLVAGGYWGLRKAFVNDGLPYNNHSVDARQIVRHIYFVLLEHLGSVATESTGNNEMDDESFGALLFDYYCLLSIVQRRRHHRLLTWQSERLQEIENDIWFQVQPHHTVRQRFEIVRTWLMQEVF
ncbi:MAG: hypothetical protein MHM6MM_000883 [Cercozoa sp. M6MM]